MPPHCDSMDGPVVKAARQALEAENVNLVLPYVSKTGESEVIGAFNKVIQVRRDGAIAREIADLYFFETVVRIHRAGEGAPYTGLKPAGLSEGPVIPVAEKAIEAGSLDELQKVLTGILAAEVKRRFEGVMRLKRRAAGSVCEAREYVEAALGLQVWSHKVYQTMKADAHAREEVHKAVHAHA